MALLQHFKRRKGRWITAFAVIALSAISIWFFTRPKQDTLRVPLGVEQAAIVTYSGPKLAVAPYKWGVAVNVRIAEVIEKPDRRIYDIRYIVNRSGTFDLKDYLTAEDGSDLDALPNFEFTGDPQLSKDLDTRIQETEEVKVEVGGHYYELLAVVIFLWVVWLFLLIFYKRPKTVEENHDTEALPTLAEQLRAYLEAIKSGSLDTTAKAKMEMALIQCWRKELSLGDQQMRDSLKQISRNEKTREALKQLQHWLHDPSSTVSDSDILAVIKPYTGEVTL